MSLHMSDNGITNDVEYMDEVLQLFGMDQEDMPEQRQTMTNPEIMFAHSLESQAIDKYFKSKL